MNRISVEAMFGQGLLDYREIRSQREQRRCQDRRHATPRKTDDKVFVFTRKNLLNENFRTKNKDIYNNVTYSHLEFPQNTVIIDEISCIYAHKIVRSCKDSFS